jgi:hypothetical protein
MDDSEFEVQYSDLPLDEDDERSVSGALMLPGLRLLSAVCSGSGKILERGSSLLHAARTWLLSNAGSNRFADGSTKADIELEISDLPSSVRNTSRFARSLPTLTARLPLRTRLWRVVIALVTVILALLLIFNSFSNVRSWIYSMFAQPMPKPSPGIGVSSGQIIRMHSTLLINVGPSQPRAGMPETISGHNPPFGLKPGLAPQGAACPSRPLMRGTDTIGRTPVWVKGFDGLYATIHLSPQTVAFPAFPNAYGWSTTVEVEVPAAYNKLVSLYGENLNDGTSIFFDTIPSQGQNDIIMLNSSEAAAPTKLSVDGKLKVWTVQMFFSSAGCDYLEAVWPGGRWMVYFSAGR